jgi:ADP-ribose pyrophosphatase
LAKKRREVIGEGKYLRLAIADGFEFAERRNASGVVAVIAVTDDGKLVLTEQHRAAVDASVIDLPAGLAGDSAKHRQEPIVNAAYRELVEETGYEARAMEELLRCPTSPGLTSEIVTFFRASGLTRASAGGGVESENITVHAVPLPRMKAWIRKQIAAGKLIDPKVLVALYFESAARAKRR